MRRPIQHSGSVIAAVRLSNTAAHGSVRRTLKNRERTPTGSRATAVRRLRIPSILSGKSNVLLILRPLKAKTGQSLGEVTTEILLRLYRNGYSGQKIFSIALLL
ncbi:hypothetical protein SBA5_180021 [Candidatus Sulfotelmatomonas gaucii]|uniref:Uncharacterized protein n=1 Tax=Candidatus Sulfuritelmatomonas gaucii TaxID=2043161 RepID=A0A2N9L6Q7_9BACT|nr:hypothetical protein SBA5_180021 [Candidatus Sulfotelmatomonas gaucii]